MGIRDTISQQKAKISPQQTVEGSRCRIPLMCTEDGSIRYFYDDGVNKQGQPGSMRAQMIAQSNEKDATTGMPLWVSPEPLKPWKAEDSQHENPPVIFTVLNDMIRAHIKESQDLYARRRDKGRNENAVLIETLKKPVKQEVKQ